MKRTHVIIFIILMIITSISCDRNGLYDIASQKRQWPLPEPPVVITNLHNNFVVETGFIVGISGGNNNLQSVEVQIDSGGYNIASGTDSWNYQLPTGSNTWRMGSQHTIDVRGKDNEGTYTGVLTITVRKGLNRDVNGDGYVDFVVGAYGYSTSLGAAYIFYGGENGTTGGSASTADTILTGTLASGYFGASVCLGDVNGDGFADLAVGAYMATNGNAYIFHGSQDGILSGTASNADTAITGENVNDRFGISVSLGDTNGDGYDDLAVGACGYINLAYQGAAYLFNGSASGITSGNASTAISIITGELGNDYFGDCVSIGDVNGDGFADFVAGAYAKNTNKGAVYLFYSSAAGISGGSAAIASSIFSGESSGDYFGRSISIGDVNSDSFADLAIGASRYPASGGGAAFIFHGSSSGITGGTATTANSTIAGSAPGDRFGYHLFFGDVNGDGFADLAVGAYNRNAGAGAIQGEAYIFHSSSVGIPSISAPAASTIISGNAAGDRFGWSVSLADINSDGYADFIVGADDYGVLSWQGGVFIYNGSSNGITSSGDAFPAASAVITGDAVNNYFGSSAF